jgi:hypothetical protein
VARSSNEPKQVAFSVVRKTESESTNSPSHCLLLAGLSRTLQKMEKQKDCRAYNSRQSDANYRKFMNAKKPKVQTKQTEQATDQRANSQNQTKSIKEERMYLKQLYMNFKAPEPQIS